MFFLFPNKQLQNNIIYTVFFLENDQAFNATFATKFW